MVGLTSRVVVSNPKAYVAFASLMAPVTLVAFSALGDGILKWLLVVAVMIVVAAILPAALVRVRTPRAALGSVATPGVCVVLRAVAPVGVVSGNPFRALLEVFLPMKRFIRTGRQRDLDRVIVTGNQQRVANATALADQARRIDIVDIDQQ